MEAVHSGRSTFRDVELDAGAFDDCNVIAVHAVAAHAVLGLGVNVEGLVADSDWVMLVGISCAGHRVGMTYSFPCRTPQC